MKINRIVILGIFIFFDVGCYGKRKEYPKADIKVGYNYHEVSFRGDTEIERDIPFILLANTNESKFFSPHTEYKDSLQSTSSGRTLEKQLFNDAMMRYSETKNESAMHNVVYHTQLYVFKSKIDNNYHVYDKAGMIGNYYYIEPMDDIEWIISDSTKNILGYECILAETDYHGRHWTVWFTPEIPITDGPWKFQGLPGLILEASEPTGQHTFSATGIENSNQEILPVYNPQKYDKSTRVEMLKMNRSYQDNHSSMIKAQIDLDLGPDLPQSEESKKYDFLETDYHHD